MDGLVVIAYAVLPVWIAHLQHRLVGLGIAIAVEVLPLTAPDTLAPAHIAIEHIQRIVVAGLHHAVVLTDAPLTYRQRPPMRIECLL